MMVLIALKVTEIEWCDGIPNLWLLKTNRGLFKCHEQYLALTIKKNLGRTRWVLPLTPRPPTRPTRNQISYQYVVYTTGPPGTILAY